MRALLPLFLAAAGCRCPPSSAADAGAEPHCENFECRRLRYLPLLRLEGGRIIAAPPEDTLTALYYPEWPDKGAVENGLSVSIRTPRMRYLVGERIDVIHVVQVVSPTRKTLRAAAKSIVDEYRDGVLATRATGDGDPLSYNPSDGLSTIDLPLTIGPGIDDGFDVTSYRFDTPGRHTIQWRPGKWRSNIITLTLSDGAIQPSVLGDGGPAGVGSK